MTYTFFIVLTLWWTAAFITNLMRVGKIREYAPSKTYIFLLLTTLPSSVGVFIYPIAEAIWGEMGLLSIFGYTVLSLITGVIIGNVIVRVLSTTELGMLFANPLAMICSITGVIVVAVQYLP